MIASMTYLLLCKRGWNDPRGGPLGSWDGPPETQVWVGVSVFAMGLRNLHMHCIRLDAAIIRTPDINVHTSRRFASPPAYGGAAKVDNVAPTGDVPPSGAGGILPCRPSVPYS